MNLSDYFPRVEAAAGWLKQQVQVAPEMTVVLSGGLDAFTDELTDKVEIEVSSIPHFPDSQAEGHAGILVFGKYAGKTLAVMCGRQHLYEGHHPSLLVFPHFVLSQLGSKAMILTNAVGGIRHDLDPGDVVLCTDHINMMGVNPLTGIAVQRKENQFPSMTNVHRNNLHVVTRQVATQQGLHLKEGVYVAVAGPSYETQAEIKAFRVMGADTVGMSTVPEIIAASFLNVNALVLSIVTNPAADRSDQDLHHDHVLQAMQAASEKVVKLLQGVVKES